MEDTINFYGTVINGKLMHYKPNLFHKHLMSLDGKEFQLRVVQREEPTTVNQHAYYRYGIIKQTCMKTEIFGGWKENEIHDFFVDRFLSVEVIKEIDDEQVIFKKKKSTSNLSKKAFAQFINDVNEFLAQYDIYPLLPEEYHSEKHRGNESEQRKT